MAEQKATPATAEKKAPAAENKAPLPLKRENLSLEQRMIEVRKAIPAITKRQHSDGVKYKFAKIFDVYELMTPALNEWGVNFDIIEEIATRHYENGDPMYYTSYTQQTQRGPRTVWVYEADITIEWTNADDPKDSKQVTMHAIGTNDGGPDKAKGSAWTYALKYYLFERFGIDQGEDDPDNKDLSDDPEAARGQQRPQNGSGRPQQGAGAQTPAGAGKKPQGGGKLSEAQINRMISKGKAAGCSEEAVKKRVKEKYGRDDPADLTRQQYDEICAALDQRAKEKAAAEKAAENGGENNA